MLPATVLDQLQHDAAAFRRRGGESPDNESGMATCQWVDRLELDSEKIAATPEAARTSRSRSQVPAPSESKTTTVTDSQLALVERASP